MPIRPPNRGQEWQTQMLPQVVWNFKRPIYIAPQNNQPGGAQSLPVPHTKPALIVHVPKMSQAQALSIASVGSAVGSPGIETGIKLADLPPGSPQYNPLAASGPSLGCAPTPNVKPFTK